MVRALADVVRAAWSPKRVNSTVFITQTAVICSPIRQSLQIIFNYLEIFFFEQDYIMAHSTPDNEAQEA